MKRRDIFRSFINGTRTGKALLMVLAALVTIATVTYAAQGRRGPKVTSITVEAAAEALTAVAISGTATVGGTLTATLTPSTGTATYQWQSSATVDGTYANISGATSSTYVLTTAEYNKYLKVVATGSGSYTGTVTSSATGQVDGLAVGDSYGGGIVVYILQSGESIGYIKADGTPGTYVHSSTVQHGLIAATQDQGSNGIIWAVASKGSTSVPGGTATALGSGAANTLSIIAQNGAGDTYAAGLARAYDGGGYSDWYLPSKEELNEVLRNKNSLVGWYNSDYWSSSESEASKAYAQSWSDLEVKEITKDYSRRVRPVRAF